jgi:hypothetical protein
MIFCTLFNWAYLPQGLALYHSLERATAGNFVLYVLCMDDFTSAALQKCCFSNVRIIRLVEIEDDTLRSLRATRSVGEYCWTCTTPLVMHVQELHPPGAVVIYVDADLWFNSDPRTVLDEMGGGSIYIHEHDFAPAHAELAKASGRFNVGLVAFRNNEEGRACLERWKAQCIDECVMDPEAGKCGDQNYLDEWPALYPGLVISTNPGVGLAPWNVTKHSIGSNRNGPTVDGRPVVFYHYHSLSLLRPRFGFKPVVMAFGNYSFDPGVAHTIYEPYVRELWRASRRLDKAECTIMPAVATLPHIYTRVRNHQLMFQFGGYTLPVARNARVLTMLYGIDADREML